MSNSIDLIDLTKYMVFTKTRFLRKQKTTMWLILKFSDFEIIIKILKSKLTPLQ